jgi:hypothetical protein
MARKEFFEALDAYKEAKKNVAQDKEGFIRASLRIHAAKGGVPKSYWPLINK